MEIWKPVIGYDGLYEVSDIGRVRNIKTAGIKRATINKHDNRPFMLLWRRNKAKAVRVHRLVLFAFIGKPPEGYECCHSDGDPTNNRLSNLRWDTPSANQRDRVKHGTSNRGEQCGTHKLTMKQVIDIRKSSEKQKLLSKKYGVTQGTISRIKSRGRWAHL